MAKKGYGGWRTGGGTNVMWALAIMLIVTVALVGALWYYFTTDTMYLFTVTATMWIAFGGVWLVASRQ